MEDPVGLGTASGSPRSLMNIVQAPTSGAKIRVVWRYGMRSWARLRYNRYADVEEGGRRKRSLTSSLTSGFLLLQDMQLDSF